MNELNNIQSFQNLIPMAFANRHFITLDIHSIPLQIVDLG